MPTVLFEFETKPQREEFLKELELIVHALIDESGANLRHKADGWEQRQKRGELMAAAMKTLRRDPPIRSDSERRAAVFVAGTQMAQGSVEEMNDRFMQECGVHSANVEMREDTGNGVYDKVIRARKKQQMI